MRPAHAHTQDRSAWLRKRHREETGGAVDRFRGAERATDVVVCVVAIVSRLAARTGSMRWEWWADRVPDADAITVAHDAGDHQRVADRQRWFLFNGLEVERDRPAPLGPCILRQHGQRLGDSSRASQDAERVRDRLVPVAQLLQSALERWPQLRGRLFPIRSLGGEAQRIPLPGGRSHLEASVRFGTRPGRSSLPWSHQRPPEAAGLGHDPPLCGRVLATTHRSATRGCLACCTTTRAGRLPRRCARRGASSRGCRPPGAAVCPSAGYGRRAHVRTRLMWATTSSVPGSADARLGGARTRASARRDYHRPRAHGDRTARRCGRRRAVLRRRVHRHRPGAGRWRRRGERNRVPVGVEHDQYG